MSLFSNGKVRLDNMDLFNQISQSKAWLASIFGYICSKTHFEFQIWSESC